MKAIIIENEYYIPKFLQGFIKDNPDLFESVDEQIGCLHRSTDDLVQYILAADAVIVESTWMYIDQLEEFTDVFTSGKLGKPYRFYIKWFTRALNDWISEEKFSNFSDKEKFISQIKGLIKDKLIYDLHEDRDSKEVIKDNLHDWHDDDVRERQPNRACLIKYSKKHDIFYDENETVEYALKFR